MKRKLIFIIALIFTATLCFSATFNDIPFEEAFSEEVRQLIAAAEDVDLIKEEFSLQTAVAKDFFESVPGDFVVTPEFQVINGDIKYVVRIEHDDYIMFMYDFTLDETGFHGKAQIGLNMYKDDLNLRVLDNSYAFLLFENFCIHKDGTF